jgi:hypothetical protein
VHKIKLWKETCGCDKNKEIYWNNDMSIETKSIPADSAEIFFSLKNTFEEYMPFNRLASTWPSHDGIGNKGLIVQLLINFLIQESNGQIYRN